MAFDGNYTGIHFRLDFAGFAFDPLLYLAVA